MGTESFPGIKQWECGADQSPPSSAEVKRVKDDTSNPLEAFESVRVMLISIMVVYYRRFGTTGLSYYSQFVLGSISGISTLRCGC
jgi:hypothetical protein